MNAPLVHPDIKPVSIQEIFQLHAYLDNIKEKSEAIKAAQAHLEQIMLNHITSIFTGKPN